MLRDVVPEILRKATIANSLTDSAITAISEFAQGYPRVAVLAAELGRAPTAADRNHKDYVDRLLWGRKPPDSIERHKNYIQAMASVSAFGISGRVESQYSFLLRRLLGSQSTEEWKREQHFFKRRRILEQLGDYMVVSPAPIAIALFSQWLEETPTSDVHDFAQRLSEVGLLDPFCRQLRLLGMNPGAAEIAVRFCEGPFVSAENLTSGTGSQILRAIAELNPPVVADVLAHTFGRMRVEELSQIKGHVRRNIVDTLGRLAEEEACFKEAFHLLVLLSAAENERWANNATGVLAQLFHVYLSGTRVPVFDRLQLAKAVLDNSETPVRRSVMQAVAAGLQFGHFSRTASPSISVRSDASFDWRPANPQEELAYYKECYLVLHRIAAGGSQDAEFAKSLLAENIAVILRTPLIIELERQFSELAEQYGRLWPEVKTEIKRLLELHEDLPAAHRSALARWEQYLTPPTTAISDRLKDIVSTPGWHHKKGADGHYVDVSQESAEVFGGEISSQRIDLSPYLEQLLTGEQQQGFCFGRKIGEKHPKATELIREALRAWPKLGLEKRNPIILVGIMNGLGPGAPCRQELLQRIFEDGELIDLLIPLSGAVPFPDASDLLRIRRAVEEDRLSPVALRRLIQGQPLKGLSDEIVQEQFSKLLRAKPEAAAPIFEVLWLHCHGDQKTFHSLLPLFREILTMKTLPPISGHFGWEWQEAAKGVIALTDDNAWLESLATYIRDIILQREIWFSEDSLSNVASALLKKAPKQTWSAFDESLRNGTDLQKYMIVQFLGRSGGRFDNTGSPLWELPPEQFSGWVKLNRDLIPLILGQISLYRAEGEEGHEKFKWHPAAMILLEEGVDEDAITDSLAANLFSFGSTGSRVPYLEKRLALAYDLKRDQEPRLRRIAERLIQQIDYRIEVTKREEMNDRVRFR